MNNEQPVTYLETLSALLEVCRATPHLARAYAHDINSMPLAIALVRAHRGIDDDSVLRAHLIDWLEFVDPNGCYSDADSLSEGGQIATTEELCWQIVNLCKEA